MKKLDLKKRSFVVSLIGLLSALVFFADLVIPHGLIVWVFYLVPLLLVCINFSERVSYWFLSIYLMLLILGMIISHPGATIEYGIFNRTAGIVLFSLIVFLVNKEKRGQTNINEIKDRYDLAVNASKAGVWDLDLVNNINIWNDNMLALYGISRDEFDNSFEAWKKCLAPEDAERAIRHFDEAIKKPEDYEDTLIIVYRNEERRYIKTFGRITKNHHGNPVRVGGINFDVTEQKVNEMRLLELNNELSRSNHELENFAYVASHDLQEPLRMISSFSALLKKRYSGKLDHEANEFIGFIVDGTHHMQNLINDLLEYSRITTQPGELKQTDAGMLVKRAMDNLRIKIETCNAEIKVNPLPALNGYEMHLIRLFQNLIENALKFTVDKIPEIEINCQPVKGFWQFSVKDNGIGIDKKHQEKIFQIFQRLYPRDKFPGTGMGLAICKKIVERHSGNLWVESEPGKGTTFFFTIKR